MNFKLIVVGGIAMYAVMFIVSILTGILIHGPEGLLDSTYRAHESFWRPELRQDPPDMGALMPRWITVGLITSCIIAGIYGVVQRSFEGPGWARGLRFGAILSVLMGCFSAGWSGIFALPDSLWLTWWLESFLYHLPGGFVLGWLHEKYLR